MKIRKLRAALVKAQSLEHQAKEALDKVSVRASSVEETLTHAKAVFKTAKKHLKHLRKESTVIRSAQKLAKSSHRKCRALHEKLARKLKKVEKKTTTAKAASAPSSPDPRRKLSRPKPGGEKKKAPRIVRGRKRPVEIPGVIEVAAPQAASQS